MNPFAALDAQLAVIAQLTPAFLLAWLAALGAWLVWGPRDHHRWIALGSAMGLPALCVGLLAASLSTRDGGLFFGLILYGLPVTVAAWPVYVVLYLLFANRSRTRDG